MRDTCALFRLLALVLAAVGTIAGPQYERSAAAGEPVDKDLAALGKALEAAYNAHDAQTLSALWTEKAVYRSSSTGTELAGRQAIQDAYARLFAEQPQGKLLVEVRSAKAKTQDMAVLLGVAQVTNSNEPATRSLFEAALERVDGKWLIARVDETDLAAEAAAGLSPLAWLEGRWVEELSSGRVVSEFHWADGGSFLLRNYWCDRQDAPRLQGTQVFGWDAEQACIRTWLFDSTGSFGEGYWLPDGPSRWVNKLVVKLPDGRRAAVTQVLERIGENELTLQSIDRDIDGAAQPNGPLATLVRSTSQAKKKTPARAVRAKGNLP